MRNKAFTLIELVVVVAILGGLSVAISRIFFANLKGAQTTQSLIELRQSGDSAMLNISKRLRNARKITDPSNCNPPITATSISFSSRDPSVPASSGATVPVTISCDSSTIKVSVDGVESTIVAGNISMISCSFTCNQTPGSPPRVDISYTLNDIETSSTLDFNSTVTFRNY